MIREQVNVLIFVAIVVNRRFPLFDKPTATYRFKITGRIDSPSAIEKTGHEQDRHRDLNLAVLRHLNTLAIVSRVEISFWDQLSYYANLNQRLRPAAYLKRPKHDWAKRDWVERPNPFGRDNVVWTGQLGLDGTNGPILPFRWSYPTLPLA